MSVAVYGALRVEDLPTPPIPSDRERCERCQSEVWVDPIGMGSVVRREGDEPLVLCIQCVGAFAGRLEMTILPEQVEQLREHWRTRR